MQPRYLDEIPRMMHSILISGSCITHLCAAVCESERCGCCDLRRPTSLSYCSVERSLITRRVVLTTYSSVFEHREAANTNQTMNSSIYRCWFLVRSVRTQILTESPEPQLDGGHSVPPLAPDQQRKTPPVPSTQQAGAVLPACCAK